LWCSATRKRNLTACFGADRSLRTITEGDADRFREYLLQQDLYGDHQTSYRGSPSSFFRAAVRHSLISSNPFADLQSSVGVNSARQYFLSLQDAEKINCSLPRQISGGSYSFWARFGGLRAPSEVLPLKWADVNWEQNRIVIHSPKTEHHEGHESRPIPMFPELRRT